MADVQGDACDAGYLPEIAKELRQMVPVIVDLAFSTQFKGGVAIYDEHLDETVGAVLRRVQYLRSLVEGIAGISSDGANFYRAHLTFSDFKSDATPTQSSFKTTLTWVLSPQLYPDDVYTNMKADVAVGSLQEAAQSACDKLASEWRQHVAIKAGSFPGNALVRKLSEPNGFANETIYVPTYKAGDGWARCNVHYGLSGLSHHTEPEADPKFFDPLPKTVGDQVLALLKKHNA